MTETLQLAQFVSTTILALCSAVIATVACFVAYRQAYGFKPILILSLIGISGGGELEKGTYIAIIKAQVWNRRKYSIRIIDPKLIFYSSIINQSAKGFKKKMGVNYSAGNTVWIQDDFNLEPGQSRDLEFEAPIRVKSLDKLNERAIIKITIFDPISGKYDSMSMPVVYILNKFYENAKEVKYG